jgi:hypothetical protein
MPKPLSPCAIESLEPRQLLAGTPTAKFSATVFYFNDIQASASGGSGSSPSQGLKISNTGTASLTIPSNGITLGGTNAAEFTSSSKGGLTIAAGSSKTINLAFVAKALGIQSATLTVKTNDSAHASTSIALRGLGTAGNGGLLEPSLQRILDLFQVPDKVGEPHPEQNPFPIPPATPNDEVQMQRMVKAGSGKVSISLFAVFDNFKTPATAVGYYMDPGALKQLFTVPMSDAQSVHPSISGSTSFDPGTSSFGIYTVFPAFNNRDAFSEDALNTWETKVANQKKVRFYPLKNKDGSKVANAFVFASEDYNKAYDFNDVVGIIRNVKLSGSTSGGGGGGGTTDSQGTGVTSINGGGPAIGTSGGNGSIGNIPGLAESNLDHAPANDRLVANRIENPDTIRPNVTHDHSELRLTNTSSSSMTITASLDNPAWTFKSGGGTFTLAPGTTHDVDLNFVGTATGSIILKVFNGNLKITANGKTDTVKLDGLWQAFSEKLPSGKYDEPSLATLVNSIFGYKTVIVGPGQTTNHKGQPGTVGDEVASAYWNAADSSQPVHVRMIAATHRQNNFDPVTDEPLPANSEISWFQQGSTSKTFLFKHNINEGQSLLQHLDGSTTAVAEKSFSPGTKTFGFEVDKHFTDPTLNALDFDPTTGATFPGSGYAWRFFPLKDENGQLVPNTYIAAMDYTANKFANWDYNDNVYLISNIKPASTASSAIALAQATPLGSLFSDTSSDRSTTVEPNDLPSDV